MIQLDFGIYYVLAGENDVLAGAEGGDNVPFELSYVTEHNPGKGSGAPNKEVFWGSRRGSGSRMRVKTVLGNPRATRKPMSCIF